MAETPTDNIKLLTARTLKWNTIDKVLSQVLYAVTGIILANVVSKEEFGLVGSILIFQAFASLFVDSGFSFAIIQKKNPTDTDFSTVFYFNFAMSVEIYAVLWMAAPLIAEVFGSEKLIPLSRVMFLTFIINATAVVQTNRLTKMMTVKMVAVSNTIGLVASGIVGVWLALAGYGAWAIVCYWASGVPPWLLVWGGLVRYRDAILASGMGTWGRSRVRHDAEAWVPVAGWTWCGMGRKTARRFL